MMHYIYLTFRDSDVISLLVSLYAIKVCIYPGSERQRVHALPLVVEKKCE